MPVQVSPSIPGSDRSDALLEWFGVRRRDLPWRRTRDPWAVLVSELMLQQTQDRQGRGRLVDALRSGAVATTDLASVMGWPDDPDRSDRVAATVVADGLACIDEAGVLWLP